MIMNIEVGSVCPKCMQGSIHAYRSIRAGNWRIRYYSCNHCRWKPPNNKVSVPLEEPKEEPKEPTKFRIKKRIW